MPETMYCNGIPNGSGLPGCSQASVQSLRSIGAGLPVNERLRTVSRLVALAYAACWTAVFSASSTISHWEPVHAPCAPMAKAAAICWPLPMPPAAGLAALSDDDVDTGIRVLTCLAR